MKHSTLAAAIAATLAAVAASRTFAGPQEDLAACGAIQDAAQRLACYDRLAGRPAGAAPAAPAPPAALPAPPAAGAAVAAPAAPPATPAPSQRPGAPADSRSFGSYSAEHPAGPPVPQTLTAKVTELGKTIDGKPTVTLEGGALWLLDEADPLLAVGDTVTISRGMLGSFLLRTQSKRLHHVQRIR
ncbi:MAG TPA: hypothetical protein VKT54_05100 [Steroidobacteraceae bacterium]|nr:hypothetical protein [Steroidobacteraceae bacterium]